MISPPGRQPFSFAHAASSRFGIGDLDRQEEIAARIAPRQLVLALGRAEIAFPLLVAVRVQAELDRVLGDDAVAPVQVQPPLALDDDDFVGLLERLVRPGGPVCVGRGRHRRRHVRRRAGDRTEAQRSQLCGGLGHACTGPRRSRCLRLPGRATSGAAAGTAGAAGVALRNGPETLGQRRAAGQRRPGRTRALPTSNEMTRARFMGWGL